MPIFFPKYAQLRNYLNWLLRQRVAGRRTGERTARMGIEALESRQLLTATLTTTVVGPIPDFGPTWNAPATLHLEATVDFETFDGVTAPALPAGWSQSTTGTNSWVTSNSGSDAGTNHAFITNPTTASDASLTSNFVKITLENGRLSFRNSYDTENAFDGGVLEISINGGPFTDIITAGGVFVAGGYNGTLDGESNALDGRAGWTGNSGGYITTTVDLPATTHGQHVNFRWRFGSDTSVSRTGWGIDTVQLTDVPVTQDFGDAPAPYPVTLAEDGARHTPGTLFLGTTIDADLNGLHSVLATADGSDEYGVNFSSGVDPSETENVSVVASQAGVINAWIDFNRDGDWSDSGEQIFTNTAVAAGTNALTFAVPADATKGQSYARFRLGTANV